MDEGRDNAADKPSPPTDGRVRLGVLTPHAAPGPEVELPLMAAGRVVVTVERLGDESARGDVGSSPSSSSQLAALSRPEILDRGASRLARSGVAAIGYASTTTAYAIGFEAETAMASRLADRAGAPVASSCAAAVLALRVLDVERVALIGAPWFDPSFNELGAAYFAAQGFDVVSSESATLGMDPAPAQIDTASVVEWTVAHVPDAAEGIFIGGTGFRTVAAISALESSLARPVLTANQVLLWQLLTIARSQHAVVGYGELFRHKP